VYLTMVSIQHLFKKHQLFASIALLLLILMPLHIMAQNPIIQGRVTDAATSTPLPGVNISVSDQHGVATDANGFYSIATETGKIKLLFRFVGYNSESRILELEAGEKRTLHIALTEQAQLLNELVVSASRYEEKISDVIVSMETISLEKIENTHTTSIETALQQVPGLMFLDDQVSIRSGNGYSYGVGSRVLLMLDDLPMLTGAGGEAKWNFIPLENLSQVEVIKGASSALYGSSALNGVINVRTAYPTVTPKTSIMLYSGLYGNPKRQEIAWWGDAKPYYTGVRFSHSRMIGNLDLVVGAHVNKDAGYRENEKDESVRFNINTRYRSKKVTGLSYGVNGNAMFSRGGNFLLWMDGDTNVYRASPDFDQSYNNSRFNIDPHITYHTANNGRHTLKGRLFKVAYDNDTLMHNYDDSYFAEYQYLKRWNNGLNLTLGSSITYIQSFSNLFGDTMHMANNQAIYFQADKRYRKWRFSLGGRYEWHRIDNLREESKPLLRAGLNYQAADYTFVRASFGQGFRYPAIAEKFAATEVGALKIFPNDTLRPEYGWNAEIGLKQGFSIGKLQGYADAALFWSEYENMIEFTFGQHYPPSITNPNLIDFFNYTGFKAYNISNARIAGFEISLGGKGFAGPVMYSFNTGYTFTDPVDKDFGTREINTATTDQNILKYRFYHNVKLSLDAEYRNFSSGLTIDYHSYMINIDLAFEDSLRVDGVGLPIFILPGLRDYRQKNNTGDILLNWRMGWEPADRIKISFIINNLFNREYMTRPADVGPPRTFAVQLGMKF
jgi:outer membrane receptor protein involved in Fe transport